MASSTLNNLSAKTPATTSLIYIVNTPFGAGDDGKATLQSVTESLGIPRILYEQGLPMIVLPTGTTTVGGALTLGTALPWNPAPAKAYCYVPAATTDAGDPAGWYYCTFSTTTAGQIYRNSYTPSVTPPLVPGSPTAPTGAANWTGVTTLVTAATFSVPANALSANGQLAFQFGTGQTNNANSKSVQLTFGAFNVLTSTSGSLTSSTTTTWGLRVANSGATNVQVASGQERAASMTPVFGTVDTTSGVTVTASLIHGTATDVLILLPFSAVLYATGS